MRVLGIDFGAARIGVAVGVTEASIATPRPTISATGTLARDIDAIVKVAKDEEVELVVVGVPYGTEDSKQERICKRVAEDLRQRGWSVATIDESLTSIEAQTRLTEAGLTGAQRKRHRDGEAACLILQRYFMENPND
ncbi:MAG: Holliday junction resolvase RuvX [Armatimonadetes bacterium]|nr:Holliday junction resolvase RuvX [Armatimonadota bacterium]